MLSLAEWLKKKKKKKSWCSYPWIMITRNISFKLVGMKMTVSFWTLHLPAGLSKHLTATKVNAWPSIYLGMSKSLTIWQTEGSALGYHIVVSSTTPVLTFCIIIESPDWHLEYFPPFRKRSVSLQLFLPYKVWSPWQHGNMNWQSYWPILSWTRGIWHVGPCLLCGTQVRKSALHCDILYSPGPFV